MIARVAMPAFIFISIPCTEGESDEAIIARAAEVVETAEANEESFEIGEGFGESADARVYPAHTDESRVSTEGAYINNVEEVDE